MEYYVKEYLLKYNFIQEPIPDAYLSTIYNLFHNNIHNEVENSLVLLHYGIYHEINSNYQLAEQYYLRSITFGNVRAMNLLALYYDRDGERDNAEKYWLMAVEHGNTTAMNNLALHYNEFEAALEYYLMAIDHKDYSHLNYFIFDCKQYKSASHLVLVFNKILNVGYNMAIVNTLVKITIKWNSLQAHDMLNVLINIDMTKCKYDYVFDLLP